MFSLLAAISSMTMCPSAKVSLLKIIKEILYRRLVVGSAPDSFHVDTRLYEDFGHAQV